MKRALVLGTAVAHGFPVNRDHLTDFKPAKGGHPSTEAALEGFWVQGFENPPIRVLGRSPPTHVQESPEPIGLKVGEISDGSEGLLAAGNADDGSNQHVDQRVPEVSPGLPQVIQILEEIAQRARGTLGWHPSLRSNPFLEYKALQRSDLFSGA
jgi:hypothetical protein